MAGAAGGSPGGLGGGPADGSAEAAGAGDGFGIDHLPYGCALMGDRRRLVTRFGNRILDLAAAVPDRPELAAETLNPLLAAGPAVWNEVRTAITDHLRAQPNSPHLQPLEQVALVLPFAVADYVDFYASEHHAANLGRLFRPDSEPLLPNWKHLPVGYHGRSGTVVVSGTDVIRPCGQRKSPSESSPGFGPSTRLDIEAEVGFVVGPATTLGETVPVADFREHVFGVCLLNDWSARDIQAWEYVPLGPFLGKSFATSVSAWITPLAALDHAWTAAPARDVAVLDYLQETVDGALDLRLEVVWNGTVVSHPPFASMYWTGAQMLAHLTVNGASIRPGDLFASGTVSGPDPSTEGSFIELSHGGTRPLSFANGSTRTFLEDGDTVTLRATAPGPNGTTIQLGEVAGTVRAAQE